MEVELFDLNKEPIEKKRKREDNSSTENGKQGSVDGLTQVVGRVLRSRTMVTDGEEQVISSEVVETEDKVDCEMLVSTKRKRGRPPKSEKRRPGRPPKQEKRRPGRPPKSEKRRPGRPPKSERNNEDGKRDGKGVEREKVEDHQKGRGWGRKKLKGRLGRPPRMDLPLNCRREASGPVKCKKVDEKKISSGQGRKKEKGQRGRPPKKENGMSAMAFRKKKANKDNDEHVTDEHIKKNGNGMKAGSYSVGEQMNVYPDDAGKIIVKGELGKEECAQGMEMGRRAEQQLVRDKIIAMLMKAGWTIEYRERQYKDYKDAVYVDREGRTHWSVTKAYKMLKKRIDEGNVDDEEVSAFSQLPEELLSKLFRVTEKGKKAKKKKVITKKTSQGITKKEPYRNKLLGQRIKSKPDRSKGRVLLARKHGEESDGVNFELYEGKRSLLSWMIDQGAVSSGEKVLCKTGKTRKGKFEGRITKDGIRCACCDKMHTVRDFESHAGGELGEPYKNIYLESGNSLLQCLMNSWRKQLETDNTGLISVDLSDDPNDDTCNVCADGGDLICCDSCPSTFHYGCLCINSVPSGDWHCVFCSCKFCGVAGVSASTTDESPDSIDSELFICRLCEDKFHLRCMQENDGTDFEYTEPSFCGKDCQQILDRLMVLLGVRHELEGGYSYTILQHRDVNDDASLVDVSSKVESNSKLAVAFSVMDECFQPITEHRTGTNMIHNVVYNRGSNLRRLNYRGFFTVALENGDELVAVASIRIHGKQLAEMPFIGTRFLYRRQGMCSRLLNAIETVLRSLGIEKLVIPAIAALNETWTKVFGFMPLEESEKHEMRRMSMIAFPGVDMLQKPLLTHQLSKVQTDVAATECKEVRIEHQNMQEAEKDIRDATGSNSSADVKSQNHSEVTVVDSGSAVANDCLNGASDAKSAAEFLEEPMCHENHLQCLFTSEDNSLFSETHSAADHNSQL